jgi:nucleoside-diphosphate-sugar epimerase
VQIRYIRLIRVLSTIKEETMTKPKVLITGASGLIGRLTIAGLSDKYEFSALNRRPVAGIPSLQADINDAEAIKPAFQGMDMVLHLSANTTDVFDWKDTMATTMMGTLNVYQAAQAAGVRRRKTCSIQGRGLSARRPNAASKTGTERKVSTSR